MPKLSDVDNFCEDLPEITTVKYIYKNKFHPEGLFSEQIFGPLKNYTCQCKKYHGVSAEGQTCPICNVPITNTIKRRRQFAKICLPIKVINPIFYDLLLKIGGRDIRKLIEPLMNNELSVLYITDQDIYISSDGNIIPNADKFEKSEAIEELVKKLCEEDPIKYKVIQDNIEKLFIKNVLVLPPELRPASANTSKFSDIVVDKINRFYIQILTKVDGLNATIVNINHSNNKELYYYYFKGLQRNVTELYKFVLETLSKKKGLIRGNILGKRIDFSGRAVIVPDPSLNLDECILPYTMFLELYKSKIIQKLIEIGKFKYINKAIDYIDECIKTKNPSLLKICEYISKDEICILNRQPSLHRLGTIAFKIKVEPKMYMLSDVIRIHPLCCAGFNADFDGDSVSCTVNYKYEEQIYETHISDMLATNLFEWRESKNNDNKIIEKYDPCNDIFIEAINPENGNIEFKKITEYSVHHNLEMYKIHDPKNRFKEFWSSEDHSLLIYDEIDKQIKKITPEELIKNSEGKYLIQKETKKEMYE